MGKCTRNDAREYFKSCGLTYDDIAEGDILTLVMLLNQEFKVANKLGETSVNTMYLSKKIVFKKSPKHTMKSCNLYVNSHYFTQRECIRFDEDGFIGFCGWADDGNTNVIIRAFLKWCDDLKNQKEILATTRESN